MSLMVQDERGWLAPLHVSPHEQVASDAQQLPLQLVVNEAVSVRLQSTPVDEAVHENGLQKHKAPAAVGHPSSAQQSPGPGSVCGLQLLPLGDATLHMHASPRLLQ
jgi:hypothetical protein